MLGKETFEKASGFLLRHYSKADDQGILYLLGKLDLTMERVHLIIYTIEK